MKEVQAGAVYLNTLGAAYYRAGQFELAVAILDRAVAAQQEGGTPVDWLLLAMAHHRLGHAEEAKSWLDRAVTMAEAIDARQAERLFRRGPRQLEQSWLELQLLRREAEDLDENDKKALAELDKAIKDKPQEAAVWVERARFHKWRRHYEQAEADFTKAIELQPDKTAWAEQARPLLRDRQQWDKAAADFLKAVE